MASNSKHEVQKVKIRMNSEFEMKDFGAKMKDLGNGIIRQRELKHLYVSQETNLGKILDKFRITNLKPVSTPLASHYNLSDEHSLTCLR